MQRGGFRIYQTGGGGVVSTPKRSSNLYFDQFFPKTLNENEKLGLGWGVGRGPGLGRGGELRVPAPVLPVHFRN